MCGTSISDWSHCSSLEWRGALRKRRGDAQCTMMWVRTAWALFDWGGTPGGLGVWNTPHLEGGPGELPQKTVQFKGENGPSLGYTCTQNCTY